MRGRLRLTWIELGIVVVTLAVGATVAEADRTSRRRERRIEENEAAAVATLRLIAEAQEQFKAMRVVDVYGNGVGEYGVFRELAGTTAARTNRDGSNTLGTVLTQPLLPHPFGLPNTRHAEVRRSGYLFKVFLPGSSGEGVEESSLGLTDTLVGYVDYDLPEAFWCAYAWPVARGRSGRRTFFVNQNGAVMSTSGRRYSGPRAIDAATAGVAFTTGPCCASSITGTPALGTVGRDGNFWRVVE